MRPNINIANQQHQDNEYAKTGKRSLRDFCSAPARSAKRFASSPEEIIAEFNRSLDASYAEDIHNSHCENEERQWKGRDCWDFAPDTEVNQQMRAILIDWLVEVVEEYGLKMETLFLAVNYIDRVLERKPVARATLQLVGVTCLFVACKYEEIHPPLVDDFVYITDNTYTRDNIIQTEKLVLTELQFELTVSTIQNFLTRFLLISEVNDLRVVHHADYLAEMILSVYSVYRKYRPSHLAAAIVVVSKAAFNLQVWSPVFEAYTSYNSADLRQCVRDIYTLHERVSAAPTGKLTSAREKYRKPKYSCVANISLSQSLLSL